MEKNQDYLKLGYDYYQKEEYGLAESYLLLALEEHPNNDDLYSTLSYIKESKLQYEDAIELLMKAIEINPNKAIYYVSLSFIKQYKTHDLQGALEDLNIAIKLNPTSYSYVYDRFLLNWDMKNYENCIEDITWLIEYYHGSNTTCLFFLRAAIKQEMGDIAGSCKDFHLVLDMAEEEEDKLKAYNLIIENCL